MADGQWHFIAVTVDRDAADGIRWYVDGAEAGTRRDPTLRGDSLANAAPLSIGGHAFDDFTLTGELDEVELVNRALAPAEIQAIHAAGRNGKCRDKLEPQWDLSMCPAATRVTAKQRVCNFSTEPQSYDIAFTPATAADDPKCQLSGPTVFTIVPPVTLPLLVSPQTCRGLDVTIDRPDVPAGTAGTACYRSSLRNLDTGAVVDSIGELSLRGVCARPFSGPFDRFDVGIADPPNFVPFFFELTNGSPAPVTVQYEFDVMPSSMDPADVILDLRQPGALPASAAPAAAETVGGTVALPAGGSATVAVEAQLAAFEPLNVQNILLRDLADGTVLASTALRGYSPGCTPGRTLLCLNGGRFEVKVAWRDFAGNSGLGHAEPLSGDAGYFWFFEPFNIELVLKVLDGRSVNGDFWVFYGALSTVEYVVTVTDTESGNQRTFANPAGHLASVAETSALPGNPSSTAAAPAPPPPASAPGWSKLRRAVPPTGFGSCVPSPTALCLAGNRFRAEVTWQGFSGDSGAGQAEPRTDNAGYFWFFGPDNVELALKVLDGTSLNDHWWVFYGALSSVQYTITVTDTVTGDVRTYFNPSGSLGSVADTSAFPE